MNDLNLRFERPPQKQLKRFLKTQQQKRDYDEAMDFGEHECREAFLVCRCADWKNAIPAANKSRCELDNNEIKNEQLARTKKAVNQKRTNHLKELLDTEDSEYKDELIKCEKFHLLRTKVKKSLFN